MSIPVEAYQTLQSIVGTEWVSNDPAICEADRYCSLSDPTDEKRRPGCSIEPSSTEEVQAIVKVANLYKLPFVVTSTFYGADTYARKDDSILIDAGEEDHMYRFLRWRFRHFQRRITFKAAIITMKGVAA